MELKKIVETPTGGILVVQGEHGLLECLSIGDYGADHNVHAKFLNKTLNLGKVQHKALMPLSKKWVITLSTQYGCAMNCKFCDASKAGNGRNATVADLAFQYEQAINFFKDVKSTSRLNVHFARMGEPTWNPAVLLFTKWMKKGSLNQDSYAKIFPVVSTMLPKNNKDLLSFLKNWETISDAPSGLGGLQFSINSTSDAERANMFSGNSLSLQEISDLAKQLTQIPKDRKYTLNFAVADYEIDAIKLRQLFNPNQFIVKLTPMHKTAAALENSIKTEGDYTTLYPYEKALADLESVGFDTLVFVASEEEDLSGITCGNAIIANPQLENINKKLLEKSPRIFEKTDYLKDFSSLLNFIKKVNIM